MNKGYLYVDGQCIVTDDSELGVKEVIPFKRNLKEILIQENIVETLEKKLEDNQDNCTRIKNNRRFLSKIAIPFVFIISTILPFIFPLTLIGLRDFSYMEEVLSMLTVTEITGLFLSSIFFVPISSSRKELRGLECQNIYIEKELEIAREKLQELLKESEINSSSKEDPIEEPVFIIRDSDKLNSNHLRIFFNCGSDQRFFNKLKRNGTLQLELQREGLSSSEITMINDYLNQKSKGKQRVISKSVH